MIKDAGLPSGISRGDFKYIKALELIVPEIHSIATRLLYGSTDIMSQYEPLKVFTCNLSNFCRVLVD